MTRNFENREGIQAVHRNNREQRKQGNYVKEGLEVTADGESMEVDIASGTVVIDNDEYEVGATSKTIPDNEEDDPRIDAIWIDEDREVQVSTGAATEPKPGLDNVSRWQDTAKPSPPSLKNTDTFTLLATLWVESGTEEIEEEDIQNECLKLELETGIGDTFTVNWTLVDIPDLEEQYGHAPIKVEENETKSFEVYEVNVDNDECEAPDGLKIQLFDIDGDGEDFEDREQYVELELKENYDKDEPIDSVTLDDGCYVFTLVNGTGKSQFAGGFVRVRIIE